MIFNGGPPGWWFRVPAGLACAPPKCGLMSLQTALAVRAGVERPRRVPRGRVSRFEAVEAAGLGPYSAEWAAQRPERKLLAVREPVERFVSLWRHRRDRGHDETPWELLDRVRAFPLGDPHWFPQYGYLVPGAELVSFDRLLERAGLPPAWENRGQEPPPRVTDALAEAVRAHYVHDVRLWRC